jgi:hypothetical protein
MCSPRPVHLGPVAKIGDIHGLPLFVSAQAVHRWRFPIQWDKLLAGMPSTSEDDANTDCFDGKEGIYGRQFD